MITSLVLIETIALIAICLTVGKIVAQLLAGTAFELPTFVCVLFVGVITLYWYSSDPVINFEAPFRSPLAYFGAIDLYL